MTSAGRPRVAVTRPAAQAGEWVQRLQDAGLDAFALPLIEIAPAADSAALAAAWRGLASQRLLMFVSANAVLHFFAARPADADWPEALLAAAPGPGTGEALRQAGVDAANIVMPPVDADQFDSEALWARLSPSDWRGAGVLVVRGDGGRDWLAERLAEAGARVETVAAYRRLPPALDAAGRRALDAAVAPGATVWLFSSSQAIDHLEQLAGAGGWAGSSAVATHPRIAARARRAGFGHVAEAGAGLAAVVACIQSLRP